MTDTAAIIEGMNAHRPAIIHTLKGEVVELDIEAGRCRFHFDIDRSLCHSENVVQGGIVTAMLDASMSHAVFCQAPDVKGLATLEIKTSFLEPSLAGRFICEGTIRKLAYKLAFLDGELFAEDGTLTATATATAKLLRG